jgi:hypothetical protein
MTDSPTARLDCGRRSDLSRALKASLPQILDWLSGYVENTYIALNAAVNAAGPESAEARGLRQLLAAGLRLLQSYASWVPQYLLYRHRLPRIFCSLLHDPAFQVGACECMLLLCGRKISRIGSKDKLEEGCT